MAGKPQIPKGTRSAALKLAAEGASGRAIAQKLGVSVGWVSSLLAEKRKAANGEADKEAATSSAASLSASPEVQEARAALADLAVADAAHERLRARLTLLGQRVDAELAKPEPNWSLVKPLVAAEREVRDEVIRTRPPVIKKPEDDPAHVESARVLVASLRARVEAARRARGLPAGAGP